MKKILCVLLSVCLLLSLAACGRSQEPPKAMESTAPTETQAPTESSVPEESQAEPEASEIRSAVRTLSLEKSLFTYYEWAEELPQDLVRVAHSYVTLGAEDAAAYPEMAEVLSQIAVMQEKAMLEEFDNLVSIAKDELAANRASFETNVSTLDVQVRRADSLVISLLCDSYANYGRIYDFRALHGSNYDTQTGQEIALNDVVNVNNDLATAVQKELTGHTWDGAFLTESAVEDYFANTPYFGFSWTLDYNGVTFYFAPGDICESGILSATVTFAEYPELFNEKYMAVPEAYTVELPMDLSFFTELDADGALEEISLFGQVEQERNRYLDFVLCTDISAQNYLEECFVSDFHPYYVKADSGNYLYLFREDFQEGMRLMDLTVLCLHPDGSITKSGQWNLTPSMLADNIFMVPADPNCFILDNLDEGTEGIVYTVGTDGIPTA